MKVVSNRAVARIFLNNIVHNINAFKKGKDSNVKICAVVKADAYGHGSIEVAEFISGHIDYFAVSTGDEALTLRNANINKPILILGYVFEEEIERLIKNDIIFTVYNAQVINAINAIAQRLNVVAKVHIKLDTGMSRIGFLEEDNYVESISKINKMSNIKITGCYSHFACADETQNEFTDLQYNKFLRMCRNIEKENINLGIKHISNSAASERNTYDMDMIRIGIGMYGYSLNDVSNEDLDLMPSMRLESLVSNIKLLSKDQTVSYSRKYKLLDDEWIATIPIGYADGVSRALSNKNFEVVFENGIKGVCIGNICMDQLMVKVPRKVDVGTKVYIFGYDKQSGIYISDMSDTIIDETVCALNERVKREYEVEGDITIL